MKSLNRVTLMGRLAADVDLRQTKSGKVVANFPIAINRFIKSADGPKESVDFFRVVAWGNLGELCAKYLEKGVFVYVEGKMVNYTFEDVNKLKHFRTEIVAEDVNFLSFKKETEGVLEKSKEVREKVEA